MYESSSHKNNTGKAFSPIPCVIINKNRRKCWPISIKAVTDENCQKAKTNKSKINEFEA